MLEGRFGESSGRPYISARLFFPRLGLAGDVSFIFDTGADNTLLMPADARTIGVDFAEFANHPPFNSFGIGGQVPTYPEPARVAFVDSNGLRLYRYDTTVLIHHPTVEAMHVPSLLGRDIIDRWKTTYEKPRLSAEVISSDGEYLLQPPT